MKKTITGLFILCLFVQTNINAQFSFDWNDSFQYTQSFNYSNEGRRVVVDNSGNVFMLLDATADIDPAGNVSATTTYYTVVQKYDPNGVALGGQRINVNQHQVNGFDSKAAFGMELDANGNVYIGYSNFESGTGYNITILKMDNNLAPVWAHVFKPGTNDYGVSLKVSPAGTAYALVKSISGTDTTFNLIKASSNTITGTPFFSLITNQDFVSNIAIDLNQNVYFTGYAFISGFKNILAGAVNFSGSLMWKRIYNSGAVNRDDYAKSLVLGSSGELFVTGTSDRGIPQGNNAIVLAFSATNGKLIWESFVNYNNGNDNGEQINVYDSKHVYVASVSGGNVLVNRFTAVQGVLSGSGVYTPIPVSPYTAINKLELSSMVMMPYPNEYIYFAGTLTANDAGQSFKSAFLTRFKAQNGARFPILIKKEFEASVDGSFTESLQSDAVAIYAPTNSVYWLRDYINDYSTHQREIVLLNAYNVPAPLRLDGNGNEISITETGNSIQIFPNPSAGITTITTDLSLVKLELFDLSGKMVLSKEILNSETIELDLSDLDNGIYLLRSISADGSFVSEPVTKMQD